MKNTIIVNSDSESPITFSKPIDFPQPDTAEDAKKMILTDIACLSDALRLLIEVAADNSYCDKSEVTNAVIKTLYENNI